MKLRAGTLLYALAMSLIFSLLLQFYLQNLLQYKKQVLLQREQVQTQVMIKLTEKHLQGETGIVHFDKGKCRYEKRGERVSFDVQLDNRR